jgi:hypothetical protein
MGRHPETGDHAREVEAGGCGMAAGTACSGGAVSVPLETLAWLVEHHEAMLRYQRRALVSALAPQFGTH